MSKKRAAELRPEPQDAETLARAVNAEPWEPMPVMVKRQCPERHYFFAAPPDAEELRCPDCASFGQQSSAV